MKHKSNISLCVHIGTETGNSFW